MIERALEGFSVCEAKVCDDGYAPPTADAQPHGEYQIEVVRRKERAAAAAARA